MRLKRLSMENFRQFHDAELEFATDHDKNITVIHGQNGSGKTTVLNAFRWALFEDLGSVKHPDRLAYQGAMAEADPGDTVTVEVELTFNHDDQHHLVRRRHTYRKQDENDYSGKLTSDSFHVEYLAESGNVTEPTNPESYIRQIVPENLADLFFFDGEYISDLSGVDNQEEIQTAIRQIMGLSILERSIRHLEYVEGEFRSDLRDFGGDELEELIDERDALDEEKTDLERRREDKTNRKARLQEEIQDINSLLEQLGETAKLQEERQELEDERAELKEDVEEINNEIEQRISKRGFLTFATPAIADTAEDLDELRRQGRIPSELDNRFVERLLEQGECICDRDLTKGTPEYESVSDYLSEVSADGLDQAAIQLIGHLDHVREQRSDFFGELDDLISDRKDLKDNIGELDGEIDEIGQKIENLNEDIDDLEDVAEDIEGFDPEVMSSPSDLESARNKKRSKVDEEKQQLAVLNNKIEEKEDEIKELEDEIDEAEAEQREAELARKRMQTAKAVREQLNSHYTSFQQKVRRWADERVDDSFSRVATKDYQARVNENFELIIEDREHGAPVEVDKSRGERQIASLSFIGSLVQIAKERYESESNSEYFTGGIYPVVMDSPFGALDNSHREQVSEIMPLLADQVIVMVTDSQWDGPVQKKMEPRAGKHYYLDFEESGGRHGSPVTEVRSHQSTAAVGGD